MTRTEFIQRATAAAQQAKHAGAPISVPIAVAQAALESNWGLSQLATQANNLKGVKSGSTWRGPTLDLPTQEYRPADNSWYTTVARWRKYPDWESAFLDYGDLIQRVYPHAAAVADDAEAFLEQLVIREYPRYATDPLYQSKVWAIVEQYELDLQDAPKQLLIVFNSANEKVFRMPLPAGAHVVTRATPNRFYLRVEDPA